MKLYRLAAALVAAMFAALLFGVAAQADPLPGMAYQLASQNGGGSIVEDTAPSPAQAETVTGSFTPVTLQFLVTGQLTELDTPDGLCFGPVNHGGTWEVQALSVASCTGYVPRAEWYETVAGDSVSFASKYLEDQGVCVAVAAALHEPVPPLLTANGSGAQMTVTCASPADTTGFTATADPAAQTVLPRRHRR